MTPALLALIVIFAGFLLLLVGRAIRLQRGLSDGRTLDLDSRNLYSRRYQLSGRPDRVIEGGIPEEWKSSHRLYDSHKAQMAVYFILLEEETGKRPPHGFIVTGDGARHKIENTQEIRAWVLEIADQIRTTRRQLSLVIPVNPRPGQCRSCGQRVNCGQRRDL